MAISICGVTILGVAAARKRKARVVEARRQLYRELILDAAERVFARLGFDDAKMEDIAAESGLSMGTLYSVFPGKAKIFSAVHEAADEALLRRGIECVREDMTALEAVVAGVRAYVEYFLEHPDFLRMELSEGFSWASETGRRGRGRSRAWHDGFEMMTGAITRCIDEGSFRPGDPDLVARTMIAMQQVQLAHWLTTGMKRAQAEVVDDVIDQVMRLFGTAPSG